MIRNPAVAGQFYPASPKALKDLIGSFVDKAAKRQRAIGIISPHAGYIYSGAVAGALFSCVEIPDTIVILGPNHTGAGSRFSIYSQGSWRTPLGEVKIDSSLAKDIQSRCSLIKADTAAHTYEHSLEVQLPFIQYFRKEFKIVPVVLNHADNDTYKEIAEAIASAIRDSEKEVLIVASSDMTHYEKYDRAKEKDKIAIDAILNLDETLLLKKVSEYNISMCGVVPSVIMLTAAKSLGAKMARLIRYQTSGDVSGDYSAVVGYASIVIE
ncbi:MAG: AmmeMemoRadiSam system protein B [Candidatus Omnitrophota bacterium]